jgi:hypothetical protein
MTTIPLNSISGFEWDSRMIIVLILTIFDFVMKWIAMYKAGTKRQVARFVCLFIFNTCGILPIIYLLSNKNEMKIN